MTGFARAHVRSGGLAVTVELSSVNRRQLDLRLDLPRFLADMEPMLLKKMRSRISRGSVTCSVRLDEALSARPQSRIDIALAAAFLKELRKAARALELKDDFSASSLFSLSGVIRQESTSLNENLRPMIERALEQALARHTAMRLREGSALVSDIRKRLKTAAKLLKKIERHAPDVARRYRENLLDRVAKTGIEMKDDNSKLIREVAVYADKCDISEEIVRLRSHFAQARSALRAKDPAGRSLDFLLQEMFREINTIGAKANDAGIALDVVAIKTEFERVREQAQNLE